MYLRYSTSLALAASLCISPTLAQTLPQVDLGYEIHQAISYNVWTRSVVSRTLANDKKSTSQLYNFTNIRYAQPPLSELRFTAPQPPTGRNPVVQDGSVGAICPQAASGLIPIGFAFATAYVRGQPFNFSEAVAAIEASNEPAPTPDPRTNEDCLFLDVIVPKSVFDAAKRYRKRGGKTQGAAVLVW